MHAINSLKEMMRFYAAHFVFIDYFAILWVLAVFLVVLFLVIILIVKRPFFASFILILDACFLIFGIIYTHKIIDENIRKRELELNFIKQLSFSDTLIMDLNLTNLSKKPFSYCSVKVKFYTHSDNKFKNYINSLKPFKVQKSVINEQIDINTTKNVRLIINNFKPIDYNTTINSECF
ncbi:DUF2393 domain-containing protein [Campylobacter hyointestinalis]|uniref:DUF2393 domain-containing protein n=1 Tax=Campylobacter hyointestinalis TaxID=198 RepID=A0A562X7I6_CAMHY|nr:DUF2393 family protein [Campylobacter hyointestinalis]TWO18041.1 DUF2393 domain-containing protein [Campylobacter hyointestinalis]